MPKGLAETTEDELRPEYDLSQLGRGVRGKLMASIKNKNWTWAQRRLTLYGAGSGPERIRENVLE